MSENNQRTRRPTCLVADDHRALLRLLASTLEDHGLSVVGRVCNGDEALERIRSARPDVAILDLQMPGLPALEIVKRSVAEAPETAILMYTGNGVEAILEQALACGAKGVVQKEASLGELIYAIETVANGGTYTDPFASDLNTNSNEEPQTALTRHERDALQLLAEGLRESEIARRLALTPQVVRTSARSAMAKLDAATRTQAVAKAVRLGLIA